MAPQSKFVTLALICIAGIAGVAAALIWHHSAAPVELTTGTYLSPRRALPDFSLIDQRGQAFGPRNLRGHWSMMFFGYTNCPDFCPTTLTTLAALEKRLARPRRRRTAAGDLHVGRRETRYAAAAREVRAVFRSRIHRHHRRRSAGHRSGRAQTRRRRDHQPEADGSYTVDHSGAIFVLDPGGKLAAILTGPFTVDALQADFNRIVAARG